MGAGPRCGGGRLEEIFAQFDPQPLGAASIAQVHAATLNSGRRVAVKVQRPDVRETMAKGIALFHREAKPTQIGRTVDLDMVLDELWAYAQQEMDFLPEARNADGFGACNRDVSGIRCLRVDHGLTTFKVLVMEYIGGLPLGDPAPLREVGYDLQELGWKLAENYIKQIVDDGFFHADPHPGNLRVCGGASLEPQI